jgi:putative NADH-flavin reductase
MKIVIFGATGRTGQLLVQSALDAGHDVTAAARRPEAVRAKGPRLRNVRCDLFDSVSVTDAIAGQECVLVAVAPTKAIGPTTIFSAGIKHILAGAKLAGAKRILALGTCGVDGTTLCRPYMKLLANFVVQPLLFGLYVDTARMEGLLEMSDCDWTVVRPPLLTNRPKTSDYRVSIGKHLPNVASISRANVADAMLNLIDNVNSYRSWVEVAQ